jgi:hypothetical protein
MSLADCVHGPVSVSIVTGAFLTDQERQNISTQRRHAIREDPRRRDIQNWLSNYTKRQV